MMIGLGGSPGGRAPGGGSGMGGLGSPGGLSGSESLDESAVQQLMGSSSQSSQAGSASQLSQAQMAAQSKALSQAQSQAQSQAGSLGQFSPGAGKQAGPGGMDNPFGQSGGTSSANQAAPRPVGTLSEELIKRPAKDILTGLKSVFNIQEIFDIKPTDSPEQQAKRRQMHQNYQKLDAAQQEVVQEEYQKRMEEKQANEQKAEEARRRKAQQSQTIQAPSGQKKGPDAGGGSRKQRAQTKLQNDRKTLGGPGDVG